MWEALVLCLAVWIAVKHFRELRGTPTGWTVGDCFTILIRSHAFYFARWAGNFNVIFLPCLSSTLVLLHFFAFTASFFLHRSWYAIVNISVTCTSDISRSFNSSQPPFQLASLTVFLFWWDLWIHLCWDHASSSASEHIMPSCWPTPMEELAWLQFFFKSAYTLQLAAMFSAGKFAGFQCSTGNL